jgi:hypothetical protein
VNVDLCDLVNGDFHRHGKDVVKALKLKVLKLSKPPAQHLALIALEMCMKNCGAQFHVMVEGGRCTAVECSWTHSSCHRVERTTRRPWC